MRPYLYESAPMPISKKEWRLVVYDARGYLGAKVFTDYEWREPAWNTLPPGDWHSMKDWPGYNSNDGMYSGCPRTLRRLWDREKATIHPYLEPEDSEPALTLF